MVIKYYYTVIYLELDRRPIRLSRSMCLCRTDIQPDRSLNSCQGKTFVRTLRIRSLRWARGHNMVLLRNVRSLNIALKTQDDSNGFLVLDDLRVTLGEVAGIFEQRPVAAEHVDECQDDLVTRVVEDEDLPVDALILLSEMDLVEQYHVDDVHANGGAQENT